jgi:hypothetical protein
MLGRMHDLQVLIDRVRQVQGGLTPPDLVAWRQLDQLVIALDAKTRRLHARFIHDRPSLSALCLRLAGRTIPARAATKRAG